MERRTHVRGWFVPLLLLGTAAYAIAEEITLTTYYPSPRGVYDQLRTAGNVQIGSIDPPTGDPDNEAPRLHIVKDSPRDSFDVRPALRVDAHGAGDDIHAVIVDRDGNMGIGTAANSAYKLNIGGIINATDIYKAGVPFSADIPRGAVMFFALDNCPAGWSPYAAAQGRYVVGAITGAEIGRSVGTALGDLENRPAGNHAHLVGDVHAGSQTAAAYSTAGIDLSVVNPTGPAVDGTNAPYLQLLVCQKD